MSYLEAYIHIPYAGQRRYALKDNTHVCESDPAYDCYFDGCRRDAPTLYELKDARDYSLLVPVIEELIQELQANNALKPYTVVSRTVDAHVKGLFDADVEIRFDFLLIK